MVCLSKPETKQMTKFEILYIRDGQASERRAIVSAETDAEARSALRCRPDNMGWLIQIIACDRL
jgi:hypothetical protein